MAPSSGPRILIVDDERALLLSYQIIFKRAGYEVTTADTVPGALSLLNQQSFDILLCDLSMEHEDSGLQVVDAAREIAPDIGIILMTGYSDETISQEVANRSTNVIFKPVEIPRLLHTVDFVLRGRRRRLWPRRIAE